MTETHALFDEKTRRQLEQLMLVATRVRAGAMKGERRSSKRGTSIEFADYRDYVQGDDLRRLDWNIYARLERPFIKLLEDEEDLAVHLILDTSASMDWPAEGDPAQHKFHYARRIIAGLGYMALATQDRLTALGVASARQTPFGPVRGRGYGMALLHYLNALTPVGKLDLNASLRDYALRGGRPGLCFVVSDFMTPEGYQDGLRALLSKGHEVAFIHLLSPDEANPTLAGDLRLVDSETGAAQEVSLDSGLRDIYMHRLQAWVDGIRADCIKRGVHYVHISTDEPWEKVILYHLRRLGAVK